MSNGMKLLKEVDGGRLYEANGFLVPVLSGTSKEMGAQYGALMAEPMQQARDQLMAPARKAGVLTDQLTRQWVDRALTTCSTRNRNWYEGVAEGSGWSLDDVCMLDQMMEFGIFQSKIHSFAGCTSILSWGSHSADGAMYVGRNMDWTAEFNEFPQVLTVRRPTDGSFKLAAAGWPGMYCPFTVLNEHGVYLDVHDGTSMGGSLVYEDRPSILNVLVDIMSEAPSLSALISRLNGIWHSTSMILSIADEAGAASMECSSLGGNRLRPPAGDSLAVVNTFFSADWGLGQRDTVSNSLTRYRNMTARLGDHEGKIDAEVVRGIMDLRLFDEDGSFAENGGATKPRQQDADLTTHQVVTDVGQRVMWLKVPVPDYFADWTIFDLKELWD